MLLLHTHHPSLPECFPSTPHPSCQAGRSSAATSVKQSLWLVSLNLYSPIFPASNFLKASLPLFLYCPLCGSLLITSNYFLRLNELFCLQNEALCQFKNTSISSDKLLKKNVSKWLCYTLKMHGCGVC